MEEEDDEGGTGDRVDGGVGGGAGGAGDGDGDSSGAGADAAWERAV